MQEEYPNILWAFGSNPKLQKQIFCEYKNNGRYLLYLENLLLKLRAAKVNNIVEEMNDVSDLDKLNSIISELKTALYLSKGNNSVEFLTDNCFSGASPDIFCTNGELDVYFEVRRINENPYVTRLIFDALHKYLKSYPFMVNVHLKEELSTPKIEANGIRMQQALVEECLEQFKEEFHKKAFIKNVFKINTKYIQFDATRIEFEMGFPGVISSGFIEIPVSYLLDYIKNEFIRKALKRQSFSGKHSKYLYVLVFDCFESSIDEEDINELLYGRSVHIGSNILNIPEEQYLTFKTKEWDSRTSDIEKRASWETITQAKDFGWESLLYEKFLIPHDYTYIEDGIFLSNAEMEHVSGVLFINTWRGFSFYPNPFCTKEINNPKIINFMNELNSS